MQKTKRRIPVVLIAIMAVFLIFQSKINCKAEIRENTKIPEGYTPIYTIADLAGINSNPSGKYILMNDIDMTKETSPGGSWDTGHGWTPIEGFCGVFDGNGHRIIGMHIYGEYGEYVGLFSNIEKKYDEIYSDSNDNFVIKNLGVVDCNINVKTIKKDYRGCAGAIVGYVNAIGIISNCYVSGVIQCNNNYRKVGGVIGYLSKGIVENCYNAAKVFVLQESSASAGGIIGSGGGTISEVANCYNIGEISTFSEDRYNYMGAIIGESITENYNNYYLNVPGLQGIGDPYPYYHDGCKALTDTQMKYNSSFTGFDFKNTWIIDGLSSYPYPQLKSCPQVRVENLELKSLPNKTEYSQGDKLDLSGAVLSVAYEDGVVTSTNVDESMVSGVNMDTTGVQTITLTYLNKTCTFDVTVNAVEVSGITISKTNYTLDRNDALQLYAVITPSNAGDKSVKWESDNEAVATVTQTGVVRGINPGSATITVTASNGVSTSCVVTVKIPAKSIKLDVKNITLKKGKKKTIKATVKPLETTDIIKWTSSNPKVVSVTQKGVIKAKKKGYATIMAKTTSGKYAQVKVIVK